MLESGQRETSMRHLRIFLGLLTLLLSAACASDSDAFLSSAGLAEIFTGGTFRYAGPAEGTALSGEMTFHATGALFFEADSGAPEDGSWRIWNNTLCTRLVSLQQGEETCFSVSETGNHQYETSHGFSLEGPLRPAG